MKWALIVVLLSGIWDSGLRYDTYEECMEKGVQGSYNETVGNQESQKKLYEMDHPTRQDYLDRVKCVQAK